MPRHHSITPNPHAGPCASAAPRLHPRHLQRLSLAAVSLLVSGLATAQVPSTGACDKLTPARMEAFRQSVGSDTSGAILKLRQANASGEVERLLRGGFNGGGWYSLNDLTEISTLLMAGNGSAACQGNYSDISPNALPNTMSCFRTELTPRLEHSLYLGSLHAWYNKPGYGSRPDAVSAFEAVRDLLKESRSISNDATTCLFEQTHDNDLGSLVDPG